MATIRRDYYEVLGVARDASDDDIRRAFRRLARQYHPDVNKSDGAERTFKEVNEAYEVLSDPEKRQRYDAFGHAGLGAEAGFGASGFGPFADLFESFFGAATGRYREPRGPVRGADLRLQVESDFLDAVRGTERPLRVAREERCARCQGSGAEPGTKSVRCGACEGSGEVRSIQNSLFGRIVNISTCLRCRGEGQTIASLCAICGGAGRESVTRELTLTIPPGIDDGQQLRLTGEGEAGLRGGPRGDLYVLMRVRPHAFFVRRDRDILYELRLSPALAVLGGDVDVPTVDGTDTLHIPAGTQHGAVLRLRGRGVPHVGGGARGDQLVITRIVVPERVSAEERKLWGELRALGKEPERVEQERSVLDRLKDALPRAPRRSP